MCEKFEGLMIMELNKVKKLAAKVLKVGVKRVYIDPAQLAKAGEAMTKEDVRALIGERVIKKRAAEGQSRSGARMIAKRKKKGRGSGKGKRTGTKNARGEKKSGWMKRVRAQRRMLRELRKSNPKAVEEKGYRDVYRKIKGNYFKGKNYVKDYIEGGKTK
ncbi:MAG: 50S ribosomal protein L19e [archaeon]|jgi:large subunit ribosomal protein L19e